MIRFEDKWRCCGCTACAQVCPAGCIAMEPDAEGFLYPRADASRCTGCGSCVRVCPLRGGGPERFEPRKAFVGRARSDEVRRGSTSGGMFAAIARDCVRRSGAVFGAALDGELVCRHVCARSEAELTALQGSKYVQSDMGDSISRVRALLDAGREVVFSGTPCQVAGLRMALGEREKLYCVDLVCRAVPSPMALRKYLDALLGEAPRSRYELRFRDKSVCGYEYPALTLRDRESGECVSCEGIDTDPYLRAFFSSRSIRPSCTACPFRGFERAGDVTLWDCFQIGEYPRARRMDDGLGASHVAANTPKGERLLARLADADLEPIELRAAREAMRVEVPDLPERARFLAELARGDPGEVYRRHFPQTPRTRAERAARRLCHRLGVYRLAKGAFVKLTGYRR